MKRFLNRSLLFALSVFVLIGGSCLAEIFAEIRAYQRELVAPAEAMIFVCGDSKTQMDLNPAHWPELFNFSASGRSLDQMYLTAKDVVKANPGRFRTMLVDVSAEVAGADYEASIGGMSSSKYFLLYLLHAEEHLRSYDGIFGVFRDSMIKERLKLLRRVIRGKRAFSSSLAAGHQNRDECWKLTSPSRFDRYVEHWSSVAGSVLDDPASCTHFWKLLDRMILWGRDQGLEVVLVTPPWHADLIGRVGAERIRHYTSSVGEYARERGLRYLNFIEETYSEEQWLDGNHLNSRGAEAFTRMVRRRVMEDRL